MTDASQVLREAEAVRMGLANRNLDTCQRVACDSGAELHIIACGKRGVVITGGDPAILSLSEAGSVAAILIGMAKHIRETGNG